MFPGLMLTCEINNTTNKASTELLSWLTYQEPLTDRLFAAKGSVDLDRLSQGWVPTTWFDRYFLHIQEQTLFQREILMFSHDVPYWYGRTVIPEACYQLNPSFFKRLETESVKHLIFGSSLVERQRMHYYAIDRHNIEYYWLDKYLPKSNKSIWVRYGEFLLQSQEPFYLFELLLPEVELIP